MSLQFYAGGAGSGKSHRLYMHILQEAAALPGRHFFIIVPDQYSLKTQKHLVDLSPNGGILNIDVLSLQRLAYRIFAETGTNTQEMLGENGKSILLHKLAIDLAKDLPYFGSRLSRPGQIAEMRSVLSELSQYRLTPAMLLEKENALSPLLCAKLRDIDVIGRAYADALAGSYMTAEELPQRLAEVIPRSRLLADCTIAFDGFTGFTPVQIPVLQALLSHAKEVLVTVAADPDRDLSKTVPPEDLFAMSHRMTAELTALAKELQVPVLPPVLCRGEHTPAVPEALRHLKEHLFRGGIYPQPADKTGVRILRAADPEEEVRKTAHTIRQMIRTEGLRYSDFAILTGDLSRYGDIIRRVFPAFGIPAYIDERADAGGEPYVEFLRAALEIFDENWTAAAVIRLLRTGLAGIGEDDTDRLQNYLLATGVRGRSRWEQPFTFHYRGEDPAEVPVLDALRQSIVSALAPYARRFAAAPSAKEKTTVLYELSASLQIQEQLAARTEKLREEGHDAAALACAGIYEEVMALFDKIATVLSDRSFSVHDYRTILEDALLSIRLGIVPPKEDTVQAGDLTRSRLGTIRTLFLLGANDGVLPKNDARAGILTAGDRQVLSANGFELSPTPREQLFSQQFYLYLAFSKPTDHLFISYAVRSGEDALHPAILIGQLESLLGIRAESIEEDLPEVPEEAMRLFADLLAKGTDADLAAALLHTLEKEDETARRAGSLLQARSQKTPVDSIGAAAAAALYGTDLKSTASRLETFGKCAFQHFALYGLNLYERAEFEYSPLDRGSLLHNILERYALSLSKDGRSWTAVSEEEMAERVEKCAAEAAELYGNRLLMQNARSRYEIRRLIRFALQTIRTVTAQLAAGDFVPSGFESDFSGAGYRGRIDRIDTCEDGDTVYVKIIDYKTGPDTFNLSALWHGLQLQLIMYLSAAVSLVAEKTGKYAVPAAVFYQSVSDPMLTDISSDTGDEEMRRQIRSAMRGSGIISADPAVIAHLDRDLAAGMKSDVIPLSITQKGGYSANAIDPGLFGAIGRTGLRRAARHDRDIRNGKIDVNPSLFKKKTPCDLCPYRSVCRIDEGEGAYRLLPDYKKDAVLAKIAEENDEDTP